MSVAPGPDIINLFTGIIYICLLLAIVIAPSKPLKPSLRFASKNRAYLQALLDYAEGLPGTNFVAYYEHV